MQYFLYYFSRILYRLTLQYVAFFSHFDSMQLVSHNSPSSSIFVDKKLLNAHLTSRSQFRHSSAI